MAECIECGEDYSDHRAELGYQTCLHCGERHAFKQIKEKATMIAPAYNKGPTMYMPNLEDLKHNKKNNPI